MVGLKKAICDVFCSETQISEFEGGFAVGTPYTGKDGDRIGLYIVGSKGGPYRVIDNALTVSFLEAAGATLDNESRRSAFSGLLNQYGAHYDEEAGELYMDEVAEDRLPRAVLDFSAMLLRICDLEWMSKERTRSTFKDDVRKLLHQELDEKVRITESEAISESFVDIIPDMAFFPVDREPIALFLISDDSRLWQAIHMKMVAYHEKRLDILVVALLERESAVSHRVRIQADNRLDSIPRYGDEKDAAISRIVRVVTSSPRPVH